jgi:uncharacterized lipoprotein NlpE involved in copper resistance
MIRLAFVLPILAVILGLVGCNGKSQPPVKRFGEYNQTEVEAFVAKHAEQASGIKLKEFKLNPKGENGVFVGTCVNGDGLEFQVEVTQEPNRITWKANNKNLTFSGSQSQ